MSRVATPYSQSSLSIVEDKLCLMDVIVALIMINIGRRFMELALGTSTLQALVILIINMALCSLGLNLMV